MISRAQVYEPTVLTFTFTNVPLGLSLTLEAETMADFGATSEYATINSVPTNAGATKNMFAVGASE